MGQHKHNPVAQAAARGELPPKPKPVGKAESRRMLATIMARAMLAKAGLAPGMVKEDRYGKA